MSAEEFQVVQPQAFDVAKRLLDRETSQRITLNANRPASKRILGRRGLAPRQASLTATDVAAAAMPLRKTRRSVCVAIIVSGLRESCRGKASSLRLGCGSQAGTLAGRMPTPRLGFDNAAWF